MLLSLSFIMLKNGQTYFKTFAVFTQIYFLCAVIKIAIFVSL